MPFTVAKDTKNAMAQWGGNPFLAEAPNSLDKKLLHIPAPGHRLIKSSAVLSLFGKKFFLFFNFLYVMYEYLCTGESRRPWNPGAHGIQGVALDSKELEAEVGENH